MRKLIFGIVVLIGFSFSALAKDSKGSLRKPAGADFPNDGTRTRILDKSARHISLFVEGAQAKEIYDHLTKAPSIPSVRSQDGNGDVIVLRRGDCYRWIKDDSDKKKGDSTCIISFDVNGHHVEPN